MLGGLYIYLFNNRSNPIGEFAMEERIERSMVAFLAQLTVLGEKTGEIVSPTTSQTSSCPFQGPLPPPPVSTLLRFSVVNSCNSIQDFHVAAPPFGNRERNEPGCPSQEGLLIRPIPSLIPGVISSPRPFISVSVLFAQPHYSLGGQRLSVPVVYLCICIKLSSNINLTVLEPCNPSIV